MISRLVVTVTAMGLAAAPLAHAQSSVSPAADTTTPWSVSTAAPPSAPAPTPAPTHTTAPSPVDNARAPDADDNDEEEPAPAEPPRVVAIVRPPAPLPASPWLVGLGANVLWRTDSSLDSFTRNSTFVSPALTVGRDVIVFGRLHLGAALDWTYVSSNAPISGGTATWAMHILGFDVRARYDLLRWLAPEIRGSIGMIRGDATLTSASDGSKLAGGGWSFQGSLGGGFEVHSYPNTLGHGGARSVLFFASAHGGFVFGTPIDVSVTPSTASGVNPNDQISVRPTQLGSVQVAWPYLRIECGLRF